MWLHRLIASQTALLWTLRIRDTHCSNGLDWCLIQMIGDALVFTTGKKNDCTASLYAYHISAKSMDSVVYHPALDWAHVAMSLRIVFKQDLDLTKWDVDTNLIQFNITVGSSLTLQQLSCIGVDVCKQSTIECGNDENCVVHGMGANALHQVSIN
eukprot:179982_1